MLQYSVRPRGRTPRRSHRESVSWQPQAHLFLCFSRVPVLLGSCRGVERLIFLLRHPQPVEQGSQFAGYRNPGPFASILGASLGQP